MERYLLSPWINRDPISYNGGVNLYGYCDSGPVGRVDISGLSWTNKVLEFLFGGKQLDDGNRYGNVLHKWTFGGNAVTLGDVTIYPAGAKYKGLPWERHENVHKKQWECLGDEFLFIYGFGAIIGGLRGDSHDGNPLEVMADHNSGIPNTFDKGPYIWGADLNNPQTWIRAFGGH